MGILNRFTRKRSPFAGPRNNKAANNLQANNLKNAFVNPTLTAKRLKQSEKAGALRIFKPHLDELVVAKQTGNSALFQKKINTFHQAFVENPRVVGPYLRQMFRRNSNLSDLSSFTEDELEELIWEIQSVDNQNGGYKKYKANKKNRTRKQRK